MQQNAEKFYRGSMEDVLVATSRMVTEHYIKYCTDHIVWRIETEEPTKISRIYYMLVL